MRLSKPRLEPLDPARPRKASPGSSLPAPPSAAACSISHAPSRTIRSCPRAWGQFSRHVLGNSSLPERERELIILRMGWNCRSGYEFGQHRRIGQAAGLTLEEVERTKQGPEADGWTDHERALLTAADELHGDAFLSDATWAALSEQYNTQQLMDVVFTAGQYNLVSMALNTLGVQLEPGTPGLELDA